MESRNSDFCTECFPEFSRDCSREGSNKSCFGANPVLMYELLDTAFETSCFPESRIRDYTDNLRTRLN